jgi:hypothetical protein
MYSLSVVSYVYFSDASARCYSLSARYLASRRSLINSSILNDLSMICGVDIVVRINFEG